MRTFHQSVRVVTYNIHKCRGLDRRVRPGRIVDILGEIDADIVALQEVLSIEEPSGARIVLGDFNEWLRGSVSRTLRSHLEWADIRHHLQRSRTYPGVLPLLHLDHIYFDPALTLERLQLHRKRKAVIASDHLPLVADFRIEAA